METWPSLPYESWKTTCDTLHRWIQIVGKTRTCKSPWVNHAWSTTLYITSRGLSTMQIPDGLQGERGFSVDFDFISHQLWIRTTEGQSRSIALQSQTVAEFYARFRRALAELEIEVNFAARPDELPDQIPFAQDTLHRSYDPERANRFWRILAQSTNLLQEFRSEFVGKCSPVHFFWGSLDLAVTRFSGRTAPEHPGGVLHLSDEITKEAYSHEVSSCGFWPGNDFFPQPAFYSYAYPQPEGFAEAKVFPKEAYFDPKLREFILPYEPVRKLPDPKSAILSFFRSTYEAAAELGKWDRKLLEESRFLKALQEKRRPRGRMARAA